MPIEIDWLKGINLPSYKWNKRFRINPNNESNGLMYQSNLGNQYGYCPQPDFQPSISKWISTSHKQQHEHSTKRDDIASPTLRVGNIITLAALIFRQTFALLLVLGLLLVCCHVVCICIDVRDSVGCRGRADGG